jgi:hypothetical protein
MCPLTLTFRRFASGAGTPIETSAPNLSSMRANTTYDSHPGPLLKADLPMELIHKVKLSGLLLYHSNAVPLLSAVEYYHKIIWWVCG